MVRRSAVVILLVLVFIDLTFGASKIERLPARYTSPASGHEMYNAYCASCHGLDGKGAGPAASALKNPVPDLTVLAVAHKGHFPHDRIAQVIRGDVNSPSHGSKAMPVWGPVFLNLSQHQTGEVQLRVQNLTRYIEGIQAK